MELDALDVLRGPLGEIARFRNLTRLGQGGSRRRGCKRMSAGRPLAPQRLAILAPYTRFVERLISTHRSAQRDVVNAIAGCWWAQVNFCKSE